MGFSYLMASATKGQDSKGDPGRPVVAAPSYQARADWTFDPEPYGEKALILKLDNSASGMNVRHDNKFIRTGVAGRYLQTIGDNTPMGRRRHSLPPRSSAERPLIIGPSK